MSGPQLYDEQMRAALREGRWEDVRGYIDVTFAQVAKVLPVSPPQTYRVLARPDRAVHKILYLPVEIKSREWSSRLNLAVEAARRGYDVVAGWTWGLQGALFAKPPQPPGIVFFKTLNGIDAHNMALAMQRGHLAVAIDEEALARPATDAQFALNIDTDAVALADLILVQGAAHEALFRRIYPQCAARLKTVGSLRAGDVPTFNPPAQGPVLICCYSGSINNTRHFTQVVTVGLKLAPHAADAFREACYRELEMLPHVIAAAQSYARSGRDVVIRPHPVEDHALWADLFKDFPNVTVTNTGNVADWMRRASTVVTVAGCACNLDAKFAGVKPVVLGDSVDLMSDAHVMPGNAVPRVMDAIDGLYASAKHAPGIPPLAITTVLHPTAFNLNKFPDTDPPVLDGCSVTALAQNIFHIKRA
jgi:hypothetical protein